MAKTGVGLVSTEELLAVTNFENVGPMKKKLEKQGIKLFDGKDGPWTTLDLINAAGGIKSESSNDTEFYPDDIV